MKRFVLVIMTLGTLLCSYAGERVESIEATYGVVNDTQLSTMVNAPETADEMNNAWGAKLQESPFSMGLSLQTKYMWRGMEMIFVESTPVLFPSVSYEYNGFNIYATGGYSVNGKYAEVDFGVSYTWKSLTIGINDYCYPTVDKKKDEFFKGGKKTGHWFEACVTYAPEKIPLVVTLSNFFYGADKYLDPMKMNTQKQAYSTYLEVGTYYDYLKGNRIALTCGMALNKSCYNDYRENFGICNIEAKYTHNVIFANGWTLPLSTAYIYNPVYDKSYVNFTADFLF